MASNPHILEQLVVVGSSGLASVAVAWHWLAWRLGSRDLLAPFRFKTVGRVAVAVGLVAVLICIALLGTGTFVEHKIGVAAWVLSWIAVVSGFWLRRRYETATVDALALARDRAPFERTQVYDAYITSFPESDAAIEELLADPSGLHTIVQLEQRGVTYQGRSLLELAAERVEASGAGAVARALELGYFARRPDLVQRLERARFVAGEQRWDAILRRAEGELRVGEQLRRLLEDIIVYPDVEVALSLSGAEQADSTGRMAINAFEQALREHFARIHVPMRRTHAWYETSAPPPRTARQGTPPWELSLELIAFKVHPLHWEEAAVVRERTHRVLGRSWGQAVSHRDYEHIALRTHRRQGFYPLMRVRCTLRRNGTVLDVVEVDTSVGVSAVEKGSTPRRGIAPVRLAATLLLRSMVRGLGIHIDAPTTTQVSPKPANTSRPVTEHDLEAEALAEVEALLAEVESEPEPEAAFATAQGAR